MSKANGVILEVDVSADTAATLQELSEIVRGNQDAPLALLIQDALRTYSWALRQQAEERVVASFSQETWSYMQDLESVPGGPARVIPQFVPSDLINRVRKFFSV